MSDPKPHLVLYFDVNKTVIMMDPVQGKGIENVLNDILAENVYGVEHNGTWEWNQILPTTSSLHPSHEMSFADYLRKKYPNSGTSEEVAYFKKQRKIKRAAFTQPGNPGEKLASEIKKLRFQLSLPKEHIRTDRAIAAGLHSDHVLIVPGFFQFIIHLDKESRNFSIVFRTFGKDLIPISNEFNSFCEGKHPLYPDIRMDGTNGSIDRRIFVEHPECLGTFYRNGNDISLIMGTLDQPDTHGDGIAFYKGAQNTRISGLQDISDYIQELVKRRPSIALRDCYYWWWKNFERAESGKLMVIDPNRRDYHAIFFDDNILKDRPHIVDVRNTHTGETIAFDDVKDVHLIRVEPYHLILNKNYFIESLQRAERLFNNY